MKIASIRIQNFRGFYDETVELADYTCLVGRNGSGKSTILHALNVFFRQFKDTGTNLNKLTANDFHHGKTDQPIRITVTFRNLGDAAKKDLADWVHQDQLTVSAEALFDPETATAAIKQYGRCRGIKDFRDFFEKEKAGAKVSELKSTFAEIRQARTSVKPASTKADMIDALRAYETDHPEECVEMQREDQFYGAMRGVNRLGPYIQWVFVPASKDLTEEADESKDSVLGHLLARTVRSKIDFSAKVASIREKVEADYKAMLDAEQATLDDLSESLQTRLRQWSHPLTSARVFWNHEPGRSVRVEEPGASIRLGERGFTGELPRFGHGLQRSYLLTLLQELSCRGSEAQPTLVMAIEEPEIYQHPPQARHLAEVLHALSSNNAQVVCCSHSPLFIPGADVEAIRLVREDGSPCRSSVSAVTYAALATRLEAAEQKLLTDSGLLAKLHPALNPTLNEMFFCNRLILVEGIEDLAHITTYLQLSGLMNDFRALGCHIVPVGGKSELIKPVAIAKEFGIPVYIVFDADTDKAKEDEIKQHKRENRSLQLLMGVQKPDEWPDDHILEERYCIWKPNLTAAIQCSMGDNWTQAMSKADAHYGRPGKLQKNPVAIAHAHEHAWGADHRCAELEALTQRIIHWAKSPTA